MSTSTASVVSPSRNHRTKGSTPSAELDQAKLSATRPAVDTAGQNPPVRRRPAAAAVVKQARAQAVRDEQAAKLQSEQASSPSPASAPKAGLAAGTGVQQPPKTASGHKPVVIMAPQYGNAQGDDLIANDAKHFKARMEAAGYQVIDATNLTGDQLKAKVKGEMPKGYQGPSLLYTGGHGAVAHHEGNKGNHHEIFTSNTPQSGKPNRTIETARDILRPVYDAVKEQGKGDPQLSAYVTSCQSGEAAQDVSEAFSKEEQQHIGVISTSKTNQLSQGTGKQALDPATLAFTDLLTNADARKRADQDGDGRVSNREFAAYVNKDGIADANGVDKDGDGQIDEVVIDRQTLATGGNGDLTLIPKGVGSDDGNGRPVRRTTLQQARDDAVKLRDREHGRGNTGVKIRAQDGGIPTPSVEHRRNGDSVFRDINPDDNLDRTVEHKNGSTTVHLTDGTTIHTNADASRRTTTLPKGSEPSRVVEHLDPDGNPMVREQLFAARKGQHLANVTEYLDGNGEVAGRVTQFTNGRIAGHYTTDHRLPGEKGAVEVAVRGSNAGISEDRTDADGVRRRLDGPPAGRPGNTSVTTFDANDKPTSVVVYDPAGKPISHTDGAGKKLPLPTRPLFEPPPVPPPAPKPGG